MKTNSFLLMLIFPFVSLIAQPHTVQYLNCPNCTERNHAMTGTIFTYDTVVTNYQSVHVASDYGPRDIGSDHYDWHGGVDYSSEGGNADFGDGIIAIRGGTIQTISNGRYKYIFINGTDQANVNGTMVDYDFGYGHLFQSQEINQKSGNFYWQQVIGTSNPRRYAIIINDSTALFDNAISFVIHPSTNDTIQTTNQVTAGQVIGPIGNSISRSSVSAHLHLYMFENNQFGTGDDITKNPLQFLDHQSPDWEVDLFEVVNGRDPLHIHRRGNDTIDHRNTPWPRFEPTDNDRGFELIYPGTLVSPALVRARMSGVANGNTYNNAVSDIDKIEVLIRSDSDTFRVIQGPYYFSSLRLDGRVNNETRHPANFVNRGQGEDGRTGMQPWSYSDRRQRPWDFYHYADFITRIHTNDPMDGNQTPTLIAECPQDARYLDGKYDIMTILTNAMGELDSSVIRHFTLDNFKPFIQQVQVEFGNQLVYHQLWECNNNCIELENEIPEGEANYDDINGGITVRVQTSEPLDSLLMSIRPWNIFNQEPDPNPSDSTDARSWVFSVDASQIISGVDVRFQFQGQDCSQNTLIQFDDSHRNRCVNVPKRDTTDWLNPDSLGCGIDSVHFFYLACDSTGFQKEGSTTRSVTEETVVIINGENCFANSTTWSSSPASGLWVNDGSIDLDVNESLGIGAISYEWSNGEITQDIDQLLPGEYCVTIQDAFCCQSSHCIEVGDECLQYLFHYAEYTWTCGDENNGSLTVAPEEGLPPYTYHWSNGSNNATAENLGVGWHSVTVIDAIGCQQEASLYLSAKNIQISGDKSLPCSMASRDGAIDVSISGNGRWPYTYQWSNGASTQDITGLAAGQYCLTLTDGDSCQQTTCFDLNAELEIYVSHVQNVPFCEASGSTCLGSINLEVISNQSYTVKWNGPNGFTSSSEYLSGLCSGQYNAVVTDAEGCVASTFAVICCCQAFGEGGSVGVNNQLCRVESNSNDQPLSVEGKAIFAFNGNNGSIDLKVRGGTGVQYFYSWSGPDLYKAYTKDIYQLKPGEYCVTVTDGCAQQIKCFDIGGLDCDLGLKESELADLFLRNIINPCKGFNDGGVDITIPNPSHQEVTVVMNNVVSLITSSQQHPVEISLFGLSATDSTRIHIIIGSCEFEFSFLLNEEPFSLVFLQEREDTCVYAQRCRDFLLGEYYIATFYNIANAQGGSFQPCEVPIYCGNNFIRNKQFDKKTVKAYEYKVMLDQAIASGLWGATGQWYTDNLLARYESETRDRKVCKKIRYCPANMYAWNFGNAGTSPRANSITPIGNGCTKIDCKWPKEDYTVCTGNLPWPTEIDDLVRTGGNIPNDCFLRSYNLWQLILWHQNGDLQTQHPEYIGTELESLLNVYQGDPRAKCATIIFCVGDFNRIIFNNVETVDCPDVTIDPNSPFVFQRGCETVYSDGINQLHTVVCFASGSLIPYFTNVAFNLNGPLFRNQVVNPTSNKIIADTIQEEELSEIGWLRSEGEMIPQSIIKSPTTDYLHNYTHNSLQLHKVPAPGLQFHLDDWDEERTVYCLEAELGKASQIVYEDSLDYWVADLVSDLLLEINHFSKQKNEIVIGGKFTGALTYFNTSLGSTDLSSIFLLKLSYEGAVNSFQVIENIKWDQVAFSENRNGVLNIASQYEDDWIDVNGDRWSMGETGGIAIIEIDTSDLMSLVNVLYGGQDLDLKEITITENQNKLALSMVTAEVVELNAEIIYGGGTSHLLIIGLNAAGDLDWMDSIKNNSLDISKLDLTYGDEDLYLGLTFRDSIEVGGQTYHSNGETDIAILKYSPSGSVNWVKQSGSEDPENVSQLFYDAGVIYFGGEFSGDTQERIIGGYQFMNYTTLDQRVYLSYELSIEEEGEDRRRKEERIALNKEPSITVFPNPFSDRLNVEVFDKEVKTIIVFDAIGKQIQNAKIENRDRFYLNFSNQSPGIYFVKAVDQKGKMIAIQKVVYQP